MEIYEDGLMENEVKEIADEVNITAIHINEMIQDRIRYYDFENDINSMVYDVQMKDGKPMYNKIIDTDFERGHITLQPTEIECE